MVPLSRRLAAEALGTAWLVFGGCGTAVLASGHSWVGILGVALAFGLTVVTMAYAIGHVSGCHLNPAVTLGLVVGKRFPAKDLPAYWVAQVLGGLAGAALVYLIAKGKPGWTPGGFASNGFGELSPEKYSLAACFAAETALTAFFLIVILGATHGRAPGGFAGLAIGLCLALIHLIAIPVTNVSVNPARSTAVVPFATSGALEQLWLFWVAPLAGAVLGALVWSFVGGHGEEPNAA